MTFYSRRDFLRRGAAGAAGVGLFMNGKYVPVEAAPVPRPASANDRVNVGFIGFGIRGNILFENAKKTGQANFLEVCDCYRGHLDRARERADGKIDVNFADYRKLLDRKDIDAVIVAVPDHSHRRIFLDAVAAGKDVYVEKPMTHTIEEGKAMIDAARLSNRIVQVGSQFVSSAQARIAKDMVAAGKLGKVTKVTAAYNRNSSTGAWNYPIPPDLQNGVNFKWDEWLGPAPQRPFDAERVFRYRKYWDYSGGISTDLFVHLINTIHFIMAASMPASVTATGGILYRRDGREVPDTLDALFDYPEGFHVNMASTFNSESTAGEGIQFLGTDASLSLTLGKALVFAGESHREGYKYSIDSWPAALQDQFMNEDDHRSDAARKTPDPEPVAFHDEMDPAALHLAEFFQSVRSRQPLWENAETGHYAAAAGHMVNLSYRAGKTMVWDAESGTAAAQS